MISERAASGSGAHGLQYVTRNQMLAVTKTSAATSASRFQGDLQRFIASSPSAHAQRTQAYTYTSSRRAIKVYRCSTAGASIMCHAVDISMMGAVDRR